MITHFKQKILRAQKIRSTEGNIALLKDSIGFIYRNSIRRVVPTSGYYTKAGIPVRARKPLDSFVPGVNYSDDPDHENALVSELRSHVESGDSIVIVGAGSGTTTVIAAKQATTSGHVISFDGDASRVRQAQNTIALNEIQNGCEVRHAIVGPAIHLSIVEENKSQAEQISPEDLPECDVLELDCEGAEKDILEELKTTPRVIIVETHPHFGAETEDIKTILENRGYKISNQIDRGSVPVLTAVYDTGC
ncbi:FkbM family methyltransferase [Halopenitus sp. H-Gu1]|uniref:FkbM family methyltransferase n=1 Tax=Halopenitus sp. H-Gu1 TaxID=3242697 RepID=UPI00359CC570